TAGYRQVGVLRAGSRRKPKLDVAEVRSLRPAEREEPATAEAPSDRDQAQPGARKDVPERGHPAVVGGEIALERLLEAGGVGPETVLGLPGGGQAVVGGEV